MGLFWKTNADPVTCDDKFKRVFVPCDQVSLYLSFTVHENYMKFSRFTPNDNTKHFIFWFCNMKQLNLRYFNSNSKKIFETVNFFSERSKNGSKKANIVLFSISRSFRPFYDNSRLCQKITEGYRRFPKSVEVFRGLTTRSDYY